MMGWFTIGVILGLLMKLELIAPGKTLMGPQAYNATFTVHGVIMIFLIVIPGLPAVFGNFMLPIQIGAKDVAFPRLNLFSWYIYVLGGDPGDHLPVWKRTSRYRMDLLCPLQF